MRTSDHVEVGGEEVSSLRRAAALLRPYALVLTITLVLQVALAGVNMAVPAFIKLLLDDVFPNQDWSLLVLILLGILGVYAARNLLYFYAKANAVRIGEGVAFELRNRLFEHLQRMNLQFYRKNKAGNISNRVMGDTTSVQGFVQDDMPTLLQALFRLLCLVAIIYAINWQLALASTIVLPLHLLAFHWFKRPIKQASRVAQGHLDVVHGRLIEKFLAMEVVKSFTGEDREARSFQETIDQSRQSETRSKHFHLLHKIVADLIVGVGTIALLGFGAYQVMRPDGMKPGTFMAFFSFVLMLYPTVLELMGTLSKLAKMTASLDRIFEVLDRATPEQCVLPVPLRPVIRGHIEYDSVCFRYEEGPPVLRNVNFRLRAGQVLAIVGPSGAGKSTLASLLPRFNEPNTGAILVDGIDIRKLDVQHLRRAVGVAFQECVLFNSSIYENLRYARPDATMRQIIEVAKRTGAHDFISKLPQGYSTVLGGPDGVNLSRGQNQRLNLTRAMLKNPQVLILDEATASIDVHSEANVIPAILDFMRGKTTLMITHRPEMLRHADVVLQLVEGRVVYQGPPSGLPEHMLDAPQAEPAVDPHAEEQMEPIDPVAPADDEPVRTRGLGKLLTMLAAMLIGSASFQTVHADEPAAAAAQAPAEPTAAWFDQPGLDAKQMAQLVRAVAQRAQRELGYKPASEEQGKSMPPAPQGAQQVTRLIRPGLEIELVLQLGFVAAQQPPRLWLHGATLRAGAQPQPNPEQEAVVRLVIAEREKIQPMPQAPAPAPPPPVPEPERPPQQLPPGGKFVPMPGLSAGEAEEILNAVAARAAAELGYRSASRASVSSLPALVEGVRSVVVLTTDDHRVLELGYRPFRTLPLHLWLYGSAAVGGELAQSPDLDRVEAFVNEVRAAQQAALADVSIADLATHKVTLSFIDAARCLSILKVYGYTVVEPGTKLDPATLPVIVAMPATPEHKLPAPLTLDGKSNKDINFPLTDTDPINELLVFYHPDRPQQLASLLQRLRTDIDVPARQIMIEAMVLEISETGLKRLGIEWELQSSSGNLEAMTIGRLPAFATATDEVPTVDVTLRDVFGEFRAQIQALIRHGEAEILSRPSVLTLDNRMAYINVAERIPVVNSIQNPSANTVTVNFTEKVAGITLNVRPRVSDDGNEISMQVVAAVTARVPNADVVVVEPNTRVEVARSPTISEREVRTFTRIANNTPFIIGGLVSKDRTEDQDKVPLLGDIPWIGPLLFTAHRSNTLKREVIIVITPYVLPEEKVAGRNLPKDEDAFDSFDHQLYRDAYRIRSEDVFDLTFLLENRQLRAAQNLVNHVAAHDYALANSWPFNRFIEGAVPGERILVYRQMYEVIKRRRLDQQVAADRIIFFEPDAENETGFSVRFLEPYLVKHAGVKPEGRQTPTLAQALAALQKEGKAMVLTYTQRRYELSPDEIFKQPVPQISIVDCPNDSAWGRLLWQYNQIGEDGKQRRSIVLHSEDDLARLKRAIILKRAVELNAGRTILNLRNFAIGRLMLIPELKDQQVMLVDDETAKYFFYTEHYYPAVKFELTRDIQALRDAFQTERVRAMFDDPESALDALEPERD